MRLSERAKQPIHLIQMIYSEPGVGKTEFLASTNTNRAVLVSNEAGLLTLTHNLRVKQLYPNFDPELIILPLDNVLSIKAFKFLKSEIDRLFTPQFIDTWDYLLIDDSSFINRAAMYEAVEYNEQMTESGKSQTLKRARASATKTLSPTEADFGTEMSHVFTLIADIIRACNHHRKNFIMAAHEKQIIVKVKKEDILKGIAPHFTGRAAPKAIANEFDFVFRMRRIGKGTNIQLEFQCHPDDIIAAKDRTSVFKTIETNLTVPIILDRLNKAFPAGQLPPDPTKP